MIPEKEAQSLVCEVNWRLHLVSMTVLIASCLLFGVVVVLFYATYTTTSWWKIASGPGMLVFNCIWILALCVVALRSCFRRVSQAQWLFGQRFSLFKQYKLEEEQGGDDAAH